LSPPPPDAERSLATLVELLALPEAPVSRASSRQARQVHVADSLSGLESEQLATARRIADLGSGAGLPGLVLAAKLPDAEVDLIESVSRKCDFISTAIERMGLDNARAIRERSEAWAQEEGLEAYDAVTARAVGSLATLAELASPLLRAGGVLVAWKGERSEREEAELAAASPRLAMEPVELRSVQPYAASRDRHIHLLRKNGPTPNGLPRRPGMAAKRPFGSERD
jgi:16S rRNA (guanine527-N7)-methyltransferase